jgi:hypothetical protein
LGRSELRSAAMVVGVREKAGAVMAHRLRDICFF